MNYLLVQNKGVAPVESFTLLGASMSRGEDGLIGQFGSGAKLSICTLLRKGLKVIVYCGLTRMEFKSKTIEIDDGLEVKQQQQVYIQFSGTSKKRQDLGWTLGMGAMDWDCDVNMAIRELIANAIDRTIKQGDNVRDAYADRDLAVEIVDENQLRAQDNYTRIFIEECPEATLYVDELPRRFLHFSKRPLGDNILPKVDPDKRKCQVYLNGVFVCELKYSGDSLYDYNFNSKQIKIDESRNLDDYSARAAIAKLYRDAPVDNLVTVFRALQRGEATLETGLDAYYLKPGYGEGDNPERAQRWRDAWEIVNGENAVICQQNNGVVGEFARRKGRTLGVVKEAAWVDAAKEHGIESVDSVLDSNERKGRTLSAPTFEAIDAVQTVWGWLKGSPLVAETEKPAIKGFDEMSNAESDCLGFYEPQEKTVYLRNDLGGEMLLETALEELVHHITGATDCSRDFQNFLLRFIIQEKTR